MPGGRMLQGGTMKTINVIKNEQSDFIRDLVVSTNEYINSLDKKELQAILLSGSVSRGDYYPGEFGGMVDLIVMKRPGSAVTAEEIFGKDEEPEIPYHCVTWNGIGYQIHFADFIGQDAFFALDEARKYSLLESRILWDVDGAYENALRGAGDDIREDQNRMLGNCLGFINYLLSDYKKDRWLRRDAFNQLHENLNTSIRLMIQCLYYINDKYSPAEDRRLYYSYSLANIPGEYDRKIRKLYKEDMASRSNYLGREKLFRKWFLDFVNERRPATAAT